MVLRGRNFSDQDRAGRPKVVLISEAAARALWPNDTAVGKVVAIGQGGFHEGAEVIGVVSNVRYRTIEAAARSDVYVPVAQSYQSRMRLFVRSRLDPQTIAAVIRREVRALDSSLPLIEVKTLEERVGDAMWRTRVSAWRAALFAGVGIGIGIGCALVLTRLMTTLLSEIEPDDPSTLAVAAVLLGGMALAACYLPARRATRVNPIIALRYE